MALYQRSSDIKRVTDPAFDKEYRPGAMPEHPGIYRCLGCGREALGEHGRMLLPQEHPHSQQQGPVVWRLAVFAQPEPH